MKLILPILLLISNLIYAQNDIVNTLKNLNYTELKNRFDHYYNEDKVLESKIVSRYYLQKAKKENNNTEIAEGYILAHFNEDFPIAMKYIDSLTLVTKKIEGNLYPARTYITKGNLYYKHDHLKAALDNYILGLEYAKKHKNPKQIAYANMNIAYLNSYMGKNLEAAKTFRSYLYSDDITDEDQRNQMRVSLIYCYIEMNKIDSANILIQEGLKSTFVNKNKYNTHQYSYLNGYAHLKLKKYETAIAELSKAYDYFSSINDNNENYVLYSLGSSYDGLGNKEKAVQYFSILDTNILKSNITFLELREVYTYLINYYKEQGNEEKQLYYIERFLKVDKKLDEQFKYLSTEMPKKYDVPNILQEKESIINDLKNRKKILYASIGLLLLILSLITYLYYKSKRTVRKHKKIAQDLINSIETSSTQKLTSHFKEIEASNNHENETIIFTEGIENQVAVEMQVTQVQNKEEKESKTGKVLPEDVAKSILDDLEIFESKEMFLRKGITLASLAKNIKTNTAYLSEVINTYKEKNFAAYLNDLRIEYALIKLVKDKKFRSYKLSVIAEELGYNNEQAFSLAFKKKTGTPLSIYLKEIEKTSNPKV